MTVDMFRRIRLETNLEQKKLMVCTPGLIWGHIWEVAYKQREAGEGTKFQERKKIRVSCSECGVEMADSSIRNHME